MLGTGSLFQRIRKVTYIDANITVTQKVEIGRNCIFIAFQCLTHSRYFRWKSKDEQDDNLNDLLQRQAAMGWKLLNNSHTILIQGSDSIALIGVENEGEPPFSQYADLPEAMRGTEGMFQILLSHNPTHWRREVLPQTDIDLMLAGHTHAMQLKFGNHSPSSL